MKMKNLREGKDNERAILPIYLIGNYQIYLIYLITKFI